MMIRENKMTSIKNFEVGQEYFQAIVLVNGTAIDCDCECFANIDDAQADGDYHAASYDPSWQDKNPGCVNAVVRKYRVTEVDANNASEFTAESVI